MKALFELSGEHDRLPGAELAAVIQAVSPGARLMRRGKRTAIYDLRETGLETIAGRLALAHNINAILASSRSFKALLKKAPALDLPKGTFAVRAESYKDCPLTNFQMAGEVGAALSRRNRVDLTRPQLEFRVIYDGKYNLCLKSASTARHDFETRAPHKRPYFSPVTIHPKLARVLVNLSRIKRGETLLDPFCGTGGILIEAGLVGAGLIGNDIQEKMAGGCRMNLARFGLDAKLFCGDFSCLPSLIGKVDAIATDPPYGRAATTARESVSSLYERAFDVSAELLRDGSYLSIILPSTGIMKLAKGNFALKESYSMRVHRSLTRHFCVFQRI